MRGLLTKVFGDPNERELKRLRKEVEEINALEPYVQSLSDEQLRAKTDEFKERLAAGETLDDLLPEAFAVVREAARRTIGMRHFDVQLMAGIVLHEGKIAEMKTGEGKTLVATLPLYLNALEGRGCHLVTPNDYLSRVGGGWMGPIYHFLGVSVGVITHEFAGIYDPSYIDPNPSPDDRLNHWRPVSRREAYLADITYGTNNEFGFDYLRDNLVYRPEDIVQRELNYAIVDEVDNILIDEARTPLIISGPAQETVDRYYQFAQIARQLRKDVHYTVDLKHRNVTLTEAGIDRVERLLGIPEGQSLYDDRYSELVHYLEQALKAKELFHRDKDYIVRDGEVIIVDEFTGRQMLGRRYSEGLHQAIEAKEGVRVQRETVTQATITFQNYFRMYRKLAGMTGTAATEAEEFATIYNLDVVVIPTHKPMIRVDHPDQVYRTEEAKFRAVVREIKEMHAIGRPVLVGTTSIEKSEYLSMLLKREGIPHEVLNAKHHEREALIVAKAGQPGAVTIATNMAGRGTDIVLGPGVAEKGGLHVIGTERHEARRIDNQLRGRAGRQGDPGSSRFFLSLEDELLRRFGSDRITGIMDRLGMEDDTPIEHPLITKTIESAQTKVEGYNFDLRKHLVEYDDVVNKHREVIYAERRKIIRGENLRENVLDMVRRQIEHIVESSTESERFGEFDHEEMLRGFAGLLGDTDGLTPRDLEGRAKPELIEFLYGRALARYEKREREMGEETMRTLERLVMLRVLDQLWVEHLTEMDHMRHGIGLQAYGQRDPLVAYKTEGYRMFQQLLQNIEYDVTHMIYKVQIQPALARPVMQAGVENRSGDGTAPARKKQKVGRNDPCPCGSGKKFKHCCGASVGRPAGVAPSRGG
ncbi:preprotein translocase subunit SecA [Thermomicrobiaceae bacterium CFH 74404]|uniref:Protein translocase subunit SecA n=2 Tax=Thermomicrobia TaxID=189775 RepID=A0AA42B944_9BACT|nr:preprotein translocase subunit SecA [Thermalbibacter longus]MCM8747931.1 preprotein translocase subunit SecA [Thermalbibacter longus]